MSTANNTAPIGVLVMAYGTPANRDKIEAYYTHVRRGHKPPPELLTELQQRYQAIGGSSPLLKHTRSQADGIQAALDRLAPGKFRVVLGMKHAPPFIEDGVAELMKSGVQRIIGLVLAPHYSSMSVGEYTERAQAACPPSVKLTVIKDWHLAPGYIEFLTAQVRETRDALIATTGIMPDNIEVLFTAHSLPTRILDMGDPYPQQLRETAEAVADRAGLSRWSVAWQSAGRTSEPWIGPSILDVLPQLAAQGVQGVVVCPAGFVSEHLEILYDLDIEAKRLADKLGLAFTRTALPNNDPEFFATLADVIRSHLRGSDA
ncbi:MAG TPA: ferrochelatase [Ktedonobacteraceae bacterium]|nr:ferrochelatase [Ktedonobacteraceae bacterium]